MHAGGTNDIEGETGVTGHSPLRLSRRSLWLALGWLAFITLLWGTDLAVKFAEQRPASGTDEAHRLVAEQVTSGLAVLMMVPFVVRWLTLFPLERQKWAAAIVGHTAGTAIFAFGHYSIMVLLRLTWYGVAGLPYIWRDPFVGNLLLEYQKDIKIYLGFVVVITLWQFFSERPQAGDQSGPRRLSVQTGKGTSFVAVDAIDFLEASRNYVTVHADGREYLVRDTIRNLHERLDAASFLRTHRSYVVNIDRVREIRHVDSKTVLRLTNGREIPLSRSYRAQVSDALGA
jgi:hypothetical protein